MKKRVLYGLMAGGLLFTACNSDDLQGPQGNPTSEYDQTLYVCMNISGDMESGRASASTNGTPDADDFETGLAESNVNTAYFVFYDEDGNVVGDVVPLDITNTGWTENTGDGSIQKSYRSVVPVSVRKGEKMPAQVICYINPINPGSLNVSLSAIQTVARDQVYTVEGTTKNFAMSNSVYYTTNDAAATPQIAVPIASTQIFKTNDEAAAQLEATTTGGEANVVKICVERYATKLKFSAPQGNANYETATRVYANDEEFTAASVTLSFVPQKWALNAQANETYVIKSFRQESNDGLILGDNYTYGALNKRINVSDPSVYTEEPEPNFEAASVLSNGWTWNSPSFNRSYWGMSPAYFTAKYPEVSADVMGDDALQVNQTYWTWDQIMSTTANVGKDPSDTDAHYFRETTVGWKALASDNPAAAVASVIYVGKYTISVNGGATLSNTDFYTYLTGKVTVDGKQVDRPYVYFGCDNDGESTVTGGGSMFRRFLAQCTILCKKETGEDGDEYPSYGIADTQTLANAGILAVSEISDAVKAAYDGNTNTTLKLQHNARTLQFTGVPVGNYYLLTPQGYKTIVADNAANYDEKTQIKLTDANVAMMRQVGLCYYYKAGMAYFNIPVKHLGWYRAGNTQKESAQIDWKQVRVGDFGMVRNHSYNITVDKILGLASGIGGENIPIVPPATPDEVFIAYSVQILRWAVVPTQNVIL